MTKHSFGVLGIDNSDFPLCEWNFDDSVPCSPLKTGLQATGNLFEPGSRLSVCPREPSLPPEAGHSKNHVRS